MKSPPVLLLAGAVALLAGCGEVRQPAGPPIQLGLSAAAMRAYLVQQQNAWAMRTYLERQNAWARQYQPDTAPVAQAAPRPFNVHPAAANSGGAMPSAALPPIAPQRPAAPDCGGWWRICGIF